MGWIIPPPKQPEKTKKVFLKERKRKVDWLIRREFLKSSRIIEAMLKVPREEFIPEFYRDYAYLEVPFPLPGVNATISCPHSYPLFYEALGLGEGDRFLEVGTGSGYGAVLAREIVGDRGKVVTVEIDEETYNYAEDNIRRLGYDDIIMVLGDGGLGFSPGAPYDKICITASCPRIPDPLIEQLTLQGSLVTPVGRSEHGQSLVLAEKKSPDEDLNVKVIAEVLYVLLRGVYGW